MDKRAVLIGMRMFFGGLALVAILVQFLNGFSNSAYIPVNFFHFFTIEANLLASVLFVYLALRMMQGKNYVHLHWLRGASTLYMVITGIIYVMLLSGLEVSLQTTIPWVNIILHYVMPVVVLLDWVFDRPAVPITYDRAMKWLFFPVLYAGYSLIRGEFVGWYPYPFLNPMDGGYLRVMTTMLGILIVAILLAFAVARISHFSGMPTSRPATKSKRKKAIA